MSYAYRTQEETRKTILKLLADSDEPLTRTEIVKGLGRKKSPHILDMIESLVDAGVVEKSKRHYPNGVWGYTYFLRDDGTSAD